MEKDIFLKFYAELLNKNPIDFPITFLVGGSLISGQLIGFNEYRENTTPIREFTKFAKSILEDIDNEETTENESNTDKEIPPLEFIHLKGAKIYMGTGNPIPSNDGIFLRLSVSSIQGYFFGELGVGKPLN